ncbi:MAG: TIGR03960 family B12-binding radical SAM protein [Candidatus Aminicenantaceae bacterium]
MNVKEILKQVEKPGRYLGGEWNHIRKNPSRVSAKVALVFPDLYEIGMSYSGQKILYSLLNSHSHILAERVYAPWVDFEQKLHSQNTPLFSLENNIPLQEFDILGFSLLYELNYSNILTILDLGQIPLLSTERNIKFPLIIGGGPAVFNPEPIAEIFDLFLIGDGEEAFIEIVEKFMRLKRECEEKEPILKELIKIKGVYVPSLYRAFKPPKSYLLAVKPVEEAPTKIEKRLFYDFHRAPFPEDVIVPNVQTVFDRVAVEVARGCPQKCRFCQASSIYFPYRVKSPSLVIENTINSLYSTGYEDASLASLSISDYPYLDEVVEYLMDELVERKVSLSLSSLRPKGLSSAVASNIIKVRKTGFTLVPEAGTERLRCVINKRLKDDEIYEASFNAFSQGWRLLKLYFMVGLPTERDEDLKGICRMVEEIIRVGSGVLKSPPRINLSITSFIPKPHTPFQWLNMEEERILIEKHRNIKSNLKKYPFVKFKDNPIKSSVLEAIFSRGDRRLSKPLFRAWRSGARFDSWKDKINFQVWKEAFESEKIDYQLYLAPFSKESLLPWDHIDTGIKKSHLLQELEKALKEESTLSCLENLCGQCQGCLLLPLVEKEFKEAIRIEPKKQHPFGKKTDSVLRYQVFYSKLGRARFLSHLDLANVIQRTLRRGNISVAYSKGFHPKMIISYLPALPLGMEGKAEVFEFKSEYHYDEKEFIHHLNKFFPSGIKFINLRRVKNSEPSFNESINGMVYSCDVNNEEIFRAVEQHRKEEKMRPMDLYEVVKVLVERFLAVNKNESIADIFLDEKKGRLYIYINYPFQNGVRPQKVVEDMFDIKNSVFLMAREEILLKLTSTGDSSI